MNQKREGKKQRRAQGADTGPRHRGVRVTPEFNEPFASLFAKPFDPDRFVKAVATMDPVQRERIRMLHEQLYPEKHEPPAGEAANPRPRKTRSKPRQLREPSALDRELADRLAARQPPLPTSTPSSQPPATSSSLVDAAAVAKFLAVPESWVIKQATTRDLPSYKIGRYRRFDLAEVRQWLEQTKRRGSK